MLAGMFAPRGGEGGPIVYGPAAWYDADDLSTLFQDAAGTVPVTTDGDPVGLWQDKSGNSRHFSQSTAGQRPTWHTSGGFSWVEMDGTDDWLVGTSGMLSFGLINLFIGYRPVVGTSDFGTIFGIGHNVVHENPFYRASLQTRISGGFDYDFHINGTRLDRAAAAAAPGNDVLMALGISSMWYESAAQQRSQFVRINAAAAEVGAAAPDTITYPNSVPPTLGAQVNGGGDRFKGRIYSLILFDKAVSSQGWIEDIENYIGARIP
jgi:hypothetical protein